MDLALTFPAFPSSAADIGAYRFNAQTGQWNLIPGAQVLLVDKTVQYQTPEVAKYGIFKVGSLPLVMKVKNPSAAQAEPDQGVILGATFYPDGTLLRSPDYKVYVLIGGKKKHIPTWYELWLNYRGQEIINVSFDEIALYPDYFGTSALPPATKPGYGDGDLIRGSDKKVYVVLCGNKKYHIKNLLELAAKYFGVKINNVSNGTLAYYQTVDSDYCPAGYLDGELIRGSDLKIYEVRGRYKYHVKTLAELAANYFGQKINNVGDSVINSFLDY